MMIIYIKFYILYDEKFFYSHFSIIFLVIFHKFHKKRDGKKDDEEKKMLFM